MPRVIVKPWLGKSDAQKSRLAKTIVQGVTDDLGYGDDAVAVAFLDVTPDDWTEQVYIPTSLADGTISPRSRATAPAF